LIYDRTDEGVVAPKAMIGGPNSHYTGGSLAVYPPKGWILVATHWNMVANPDVGQLAVDDDYVGVWSIHDNGDVPPRWDVGGPKGVFQAIRNLALDPKNRRVNVIRS
jgi:hypothetical protein